MSIRYTLYSYLKIHYKENNCRFLSQNITQIGLILPLYYGARHSRKMGSGIITGFCVHVQPVEDSVFSSCHVLCLSIGGFGQARVVCLQLFTQTSFSTDSCLVIPFDSARASNNFCTHERIPVHVAFA